MDAVTEDSIEFTGRNTHAVAEFVNGGVNWIESWFVTKGQSASTGGQAWRYVKDGDEWAQDVVAAVYSPREDVWLPVRRGDTIRRIPADVTTEPPTSLAYAVEGR